MLYNFQQCGGSRDEFMTMTFQEVVDFILTYVEHNSKNKQKQNHKNNQSETTQRSETFSYGRCDEYGNPINWQDE